MNIIRQLTYSAIALCATLAARPAHAHFLWGEVTQDTPPVAQLSFNEEPGGVSDGDMVARIEAARAWDDKGKTIALQTAGAVRSGVLKGGRVFGADQNFGVLDRTKEGRGVFKLLYYTKAALTLDDANQSVKLPFELFARRDGADRIVVTVKRGAAPYASAKLNVYTPLQDKPTPLTSDVNGEIRFEAKTPGLYGIRAAWVDETPGEEGGKKYPFIRNYSTLTFRVAASTPAAQDAIPQSGAASMGLTKTSRPPVGPNPKADKAAYELLKNAHDNRQTMPESFAGFTAKVTYIKDGVASEGTLTYRRKGKTEIVFPTLAKDEYSWVEDKLMNLIGHRRGGDFNEGDGRYPLSFDKRPDNNFGKLVDVNDGMRSEYRVKDNVVREVTREMGGIRFTISVIETIETDGGKYLANHFIVSYRDAKTGDLKMFEGYRDRYSKIDGVWLPTARFVFTSRGITPGDSDSATFQILKLGDIKPLDAGKLAGVNGNAAHDMH
jgi:hypothetical protein